MWYYVCDTSCGHCLRVANVLLSTSGGTIRGSWVSNYENMVSQL